MKHPSFRTLTESPWTGAPDPRQLFKHGITPREHFFVRNHGDIPHLPGDDHVVRFTGMAHKPFDITVGEIKAMPQIAFEASLTCAGNRRSQLNAYRPVPNEVPWGNEAIGHAVWGGVWLNELVERAAPKMDARHACFRGADMVTSGGGAGDVFGGSVPIRDLGLALLAVSMNGAPLPLEHGAPVRIVVPEYIAARSVKWVTEVSLSDKPSTNYFQQKGYRQYPTTALQVPEVAERGLMLGPLRMNSAILDPAPGAVLAPGRHVIRGWALAGDCGYVEGVEVSMDGGELWEEATQVYNARGQGWVLWELEVTLSPGTWEVVCRAFEDDEGGRREQPSSVAKVWNVKGYMNTAWDRVPIEVRATE